jgi:hypothetical protein
MTKKASDGKENCKENFEGKENRDIQETSAGSGRVITR